MYPFKILSYWFLPRVLDVKIILNFNSCICHISSFSCLALYRLQISCGLLCPFQAINEMLKSAQPCDISLRISSSWHQHLLGRHCSLSYNSPDCPNIQLMIHYCVYQVIMRIFGKCSFETKSRLFWRFPLFSLFHQSRSVINKEDDY